MSEKLSQWLLFIVLSFIWGSSFILMKGGMISLSAVQVASLRILSSGLVMLPLTVKYRKSIPSQKLLSVFLSGTLGSLLPAYLFCMAEQVIDSSLAGMLNSLTPIFVIITGALFFNNRATTQKVVGVLIAFIGCLLLFLSQPKGAMNSGIVNVLMVIIATLMYGVNVNLVFRYLKNIPSLEIVSVALPLNAIPALLVLVFSGYFSLDFTSEEVWSSSGYSILLGAMGTSLANILFYLLIKRSGAVFASMVTYGIPFVAIFWGFIFHETLGWMQVGGLLVILLGVYWANRKMPESSKS
jgi:drug/metabolite transporter (DMT)-like permease